MKGCVFSKCRKIRACTPASNFFFIFNIFKIRPAYSALSLFFRALVREKAQKMRDLLKALFLLLHFAPIVDIGTEARAVKGASCK